MRGQAQHQRRVGGQGEKLGTEIQIEHALMRRPDRGQSQTGERRSWDRAAFSGVRLRFQKPRGVRAVQERQYRDLLAGDHRQRQKNRARRREAAGGGRAR